MSITKDSGLFGCIILKSLKQNLYHQIITWTDEGVHAFFFFKPVALLCADGDGFVKVLAKDPQSERGDVPQ